jgi:hypothetical protein
MTEGANNTIYAIGDDADGTLWLYWHRPFAESPESPEWAPQGAVGTGWQHFKTVFANEYGVGFGAYIYAIDADGRLWWYNHVWPHMGVPWGWVGPRLVGTGWQIYKNVFSPGIGIIYAIREDDDTLWWYRHAAWKTGEGVETPGAWEGPRAVHGGWYVKKPPPLHSYHTGWQRFRTVFAFVDEWTPEDR